MLKALRLSNWCCFSKFSVNFDPHCTVFVGDNGKGKSALQRALLWVCFNRWDGPADAFIKHGTALASVTLWTDKHKVERLKGKRDGKLCNLYRLDNQDLRFDTVNRRTVPLPVVSALNLGPDNFQLQRDPGYWFALSAGDCAKALNRIVNLEAIDLSLAHVHAQVRDAKAESAVAARRLESWRQTLGSLTWVEEAATQLQALEQLEEAMARNSARIACIERSQLEAAGIARLEDRAAGAILAGKKAIALQQEVCQRQKQVQEAEATARTLQELQNKQHLTQAELGKAKALLTKYLAQQCPLCGK